MFLFPVFNCYGKGDWLEDFFQLAVYYGVEGAVGVQGDCYWGEAFGWDASCGCGDGAAEGVVHCSGVEGAECVVCNVGVHCAVDFGVGVFAPGWELCGVPGGEGLCRNFYLSGGTLAVCCGILAICGASLVECGGALAVCGIRPVVYLHRAVYEHNGTGVGRGTVVHQLPGRIHQLYIAYFHTVYLQHGVFCIVLYLYCKHPFLEDSGF